MASKYKFTVEELAAVLKMVVKDRIDYRFDFPDWESYATACKVPFTSLKAIGDHLWNVDCSALSSPDAIYASASDVQRLVVSSSHTSVPEASNSRVVPTNSTSNAQTVDLSEQNEHVELLEGLFTQNMEKMAVDVQGNTSAVLKRPHRDSMPRIAKKVCPEFPLPTEDLMSSGSSDGVHVFRFINDTNTLCWLNSVIGVMIVM
jgi:hypothetical protein